MTGVKKESHQRKPSPRRQRQLSNVAALSKASSDPDHDDGGGIISNEMIIEIDIENDNTTGTSQITDSLSSVSGSVPLSTSSATESPPSSTISRVTSKTSSLIV